MAKRFLSEEEQRVRVRAAALKLEEELVKRIAAGEAGADLNKEIEDVQTTLKRVGREATYTETLALRAHAKRVAEAAAKAAKEKRA